MAQAKRIRRIKFETGRIIKRTRQATTKALDTVATELTARIRKKISKPSPPVSKPGRPPHSDSGFLKDNTQVIRKGRTFIVQTPQYGIWLEGGTPKMARRPFILDTVGKKRKLTKRINDLIRKNSK